MLKHGDTFAVFDRYGDIKPGGLGEEGLYHEGTRFLSCLLLELEGGRPFFLSSTVREENDQLAVALTNPDLLRDGAGAAAARHAPPRAEEVPLAGRLLPAAAGQEPRRRSRCETTLAAALRGRLRGHLRGPRHEAHGAAARTCRRKSPATAWSSATAGSTASCAGRVLQFEPPPARAHRHRRAVLDLSLQPQRGGHASA